MTELEQIAIRQWAINQAINITVAAMSSNTADVNLDSGVTEIAQKYMDFVNDVNK